MIGSFNRNRCLGLVALVGYLVASANADDDAGGDRSLDRLFARLRAADEAGDVSEILDCTLPEERVTLVGMHLTTAAMMTVLGGAPPEQSAELVALLRRHGLAELAAGMTLETVFSGQWAFLDGRKALEGADLATLLQELRALVKRGANRPLTGLMSLPGAADLVVEHGRAFLPGHGDVALLRGGRWYHLPSPTMPGPPAPPPPVQVHSDWVLPADR